MNPEDYTAEAILKAIDKSIAHWERICDAITTPTEDDILKLVGGTTEPIYDWNQYLRAAIGESFFADDCALCDMFDNPDIMKRSKCTADVQGTLITCPIALYGLGRCAADGAWGDVVDAAQSPRNAFLTACTAMLTELLTVRVKAALALNRERSVIKMFGLYDPTGKLVDVRKQKDEAIDHAITFQSNEFKEKWWSNRHRAWCEIKQMGWEIIPGRFVPDKP